MNLQFNADDFVRSAAEDDQKGIGPFFLPPVLNVNAQNTAGKTALMVACERGKTDWPNNSSTKADPNVAGADGVTR